MNCTGDSERRAHCHVHMSAAYQSHVLTSLLPPIQLVLNSYLINAFNSVATLSAGEDQPTKTTAHSATNELASSLCSPEACSNQLRPVPASGPCSDRLQTLSILQAGLVGTFCALAAELVIPCRSLLHFKTQEFA